MFLSTERRKGFPMKSACVSRTVLTLVLVGMFGGVWLLGGCGSETAKPKPGPQPSAPSSEGPASAKPIAPEPPPPQPTPGPEKPAAEPKPSTPAEKEKPEEKAPPGKEEKPAPAPEEKEKPSAPPSTPTQPKQEPSPATPPAEKPAAAGAEDRSPTAKVSSYAPAEDLEAQMEQYLKDFQDAVASEDAFKEAEGKISKDANTLIVMALALGLHDQQNKYQKAAPALIAAAKQLTSVKDLNSAKKAIEALTTAASSQGDPSSLKWEKAAKLEELMKAVPLISNKIKDSSLTAARLEKRGKDYAGYAAVLAVIAQGSLPNADETEKPTEVAKWQQFCLQMRSAAAELNAAIRAKNAEAALKANAKLRQSCDDCHAVFHTKQEASKQ